MTRSRAFFYGQLSGIVEPIAGVIGAALTILMRPLLPYALAFAAGAMIYVVAEELIPATKCEGALGHPYTGRDVRFCRHDDFGCCFRIKILLC